MAGAPKENKNAEKWNKEDAEKLFNQALELSHGEEYDFIGEIAKELKVYRTLFDYLCDKYKDLNYIYNQILSNLEANCFRHAKKGDIKEATAIVNLKSNYKWTDRVQNETNLSGEISINPKKWVK